VNDENGDLFADSHNIEIGGKTTYLSDVKQIEVHAAEIIVPGPCPLGVEIAIAKLEKYKSVGGETLVSMIHNLINCIWNKEELLAQWRGVYYGIISQKL
jgi:hypothetical protein